MTRETLIADLELLYVTGVPPYGPGDLMEAWVDGDKVHIGFADWFARAPRLTWREAAGLYLAGRALDALPEVAEQGALARALAKLEAVLPADQLDRVHELAGKVSVDLEGGDPAETSSPHRAGQGGRRRPPGRDRVLVGLPGRADPAQGRPVAGVQRLRPLVPVRLVPQGGRRAAVPGRPGGVGAADRPSRSSARPASTRPPTRRSPGSSCSPAAWSASSTWPPRPSGRPTTSRSWTPSAAPTAASGSAWPPTSSPGWSAWSCAWPPPPSRSHPPSSAAPSPRPHATPWPPTPRSPAQGLRLRGRYPGA